MTLRSTKLVRACAAILLSALGTTAMAVPFQGTYRMRFSSGSSHQWHFINPSPLELPTVMEGTLSLQRKGDRMLVTQRVTHTTQDHSNLIGDKPDIILQGEPIFELTRSGRITGEFSRSPTSHHISVNFDDQESTRAYDRALAAYKDRVASELGLRISPRKLLSVKSWLVMEHVWDPAPQGEGRESEMLYLHERSRIVGVGTGLVGGLVPPWRVTTEHGGGGPPQR